MQSTNSEYGSPYLVICHVTFTFHLIWIQTGSGGYGDLRIRKKQTNINVDAILLMM